jgi:hypothetical protein
MVVFLELGFFLFAVFLGFRLDGMSMSGIDDVFKQSGVCAYFPPDCGGLHAKKVLLFGAGSFCKYPSSRAKSPLSTLRIISFLV